MPLRQVESAAAAAASGDTPYSSSSLLNSSDNDNNDNDLHEPLLLNGNNNDDDEGNAAVNNTNNNNNGNSSVDNDVDVDNNNESSNNNNKNIVIKFQCCNKKIKKSVNHNVFLNLLLSVLYGISNSLWSGTAYIAYIKKLGHNSNKPVGNIEAVSGLASLICALPIGYLADTIGRSIVIRSGGILLFITAILQISILQYTVGIDTDNPNDDHKDTIALWFMGGIMIFWGLGDGVVNGPCQALFADSTPSGTRSTYFTYQFVCYLSASAVGPLVSIILFQTLGDNWDMYHLRIVIYVGLILETGNAILMMLFDDNKALDEDEDENENDNDENGNDEDGSSDEDGRRNGDGDEDEEQQAAPAVSLSLLSSSNDINNNATPTTITATAVAAATDSIKLKKRQEWIPYIVFISGLISSLGSGMTVKFFPLFFKDEIGMTPSQVQIIYVLVPLVMVIMGMLCTKIASGPLKFGRVQTTALYEIGGILLLLSMVYYKQYLNLHPFLLVPIYIMRTSLMNSTYPLQESILMDYVPKSSRGRWKSLDSVASFGWCGSAAFGGWLADKYDYTHTFLCTAIFQIVALCIWCLLLPLVPRIEGSDDACSSISSTDNDNNNNSNDNNNNNGANNDRSNDDEDGNSGGNVVIVNDDDVNDNGTCITPLVSNSAAIAPAMTELSEPLL